MLILPCIPGQSLSYIASSAVVNTEWRSPASAPTTVPPGIFLPRRPLEGSEGFQKARLPQLVRRSHRFRTSISVIHQLIRA